MGKQSCKLFANKKEGFIETHERVNSRVLHIIARCKVRPPVTPQPRLSSSHQVSCTTHPGEGGTADAHPTRVGGTTRGGAKKTHSISHPRMAVPPEPCPSRRRGGTTWREGGKLPPQNAPQNTDPPIRGWPCSTRRRGWRGAPPPPSLPLIPRPVHGIKTQKRDHKRTKNSFRSFL